jgi:signal peptidase I
VDTLSSDIEDNKNLIATDIGIVIAVLESGNSVELTATGYSMFPSFIPGDRITVKPLTNGELPKPGSVVVYENKGTLVMHRLVKIFYDDCGKLLFITRGDSTMKFDEPCPQKQLLGIAKSFRHGKKEYLIKNFTPFAWRYLFNCSLLWMFKKLKRLISFFGNLVRSR